MSDAPKPKSLHDLPPGTVFDPARAAKLMTRHGHGGWLGLTYHAHGTGWMELALPWREELVGVAETGVLASGPIISLMDNATSMSVWALSGKFVPHATLDLRVDYMRAAGYDGDLARKLAHQACRRVKVIGRLSIVRVATVGT